MKNKIILAILPVFGVFAVFGFAFSTAQAQTMPSGGGNNFSAMHRGIGMMMGRAPGVIGNVTAVNGTTISVQSIRASSTIYAVDASNAQIFKNGTTSTIASVTTGDMVMVQGSVSGTNVTATIIRDGMGKGGVGRPGPFGKGPGHFPSSTIPVQGNGQPVVGGSVSSISGTTITVTNSGNATYTIDASSAKIIKNGTTTLISNVAVGDNIVVQGTVNGTSVTASSIIDQGTANAGKGASSNVLAAGLHSGFFGAIGNFFRRIFGF